MILEKSGTILINLKTTRKINLSYVSSNIKMLRHPADISDAFDKYYTNTTVTLDNSIPPATTNTTTFLRGDYSTPMSVLPNMLSDVTSTVKSIKKYEYFPSFE